ncbi:MAG: hypothetical protein IMZ55_13960 [Acidobacteria bacterium]|nr:hypothetical protein [Acidobacteriota bacterium]
MRGFRLLPLAAALVLAGALASPARGADAGLTFLGWSDQHVTTQGEAGHLRPAVDAMNTVAGTAYPEKIGGKVAPPAFVFGCGDITEWPTAAARDAYEAVVTKRLRIPAYDIVGNHDEGGKVPSATIKDWLIARHGALSYAFDRGGVHFMAAFAPYDESLENPAQPVAKSALDFIRADLAKTPKGTPVVVALHLCLDAITNRDEVVAAFGDSNVILVLGGHYHKATVGEYRGFRFVQLPSPASETEFTVVRITADRLVAIPFDFKAGKWSGDAKKVLDVPVRGPK